VGVPALGLYLWLGMAMSGPVLLLRRRASATSGSPPSSGPLESPHAHSWAELAWSLIGAYWIVVGIFVIPARLHEFKPRDMVLFGFMPVVVALLLRLLGPPAAAHDARKSTRPWTHLAGVVLVLTWPIAWTCLIVLGMTMR
jgi:hypothetical protein